MKAICQWLDSSEDSHCFHSSAANVNWKVSSCWVVAYFNFMRNCKWNCAIISAHPHGSPFDTRRALIKTIEPRTSLQIIHILMSWVFSSCPQEIMTIFRYICYDSVTDKLFSSDFHLQWRWVPQDRLAWIITQNTGWKEWQMMNPNPWHPTAEPSTAEHIKLSTVYNRRGIFSKLWP